MSYSDAITLDGDSYAPPTEGSFTFDLMWRDSKDGSLRQVASSATTNPHQLLIKHQQSKRNGVDRVRSVIRLDRDYSDAILGTVGASVYTVVDRPVRTDVTEDNIFACIARMQHFLATSGHKSKLLNMEG